MKLIKFARLNENVLFNFSNTNIKQCDSLKVHKRKQKLKIIINQLTIS